MQKPASPTSRNIEKAIIGLLIIAVVASMIWAVIDHTPEPLANFPAQMATLLIFLREWRMRE